MSRTLKGMINSWVALSCYAIELLIGFWSRKVFLDFLGSELLGLNTTATNLLQFLNIAELGIGSAVAFTLYKPLSQNDFNAINEIISVQGWLYRKIANIVAIGAAVMMCFFPLIFSKIELPLWYAYSSFGVFLYSSLLTYYFNYRQIALSASQQEYKITISYKSFIIIKNIVQIIAISHFSHPYIWWLILQIVFATLASISLNVQIKRTFPNLKPNVKQGRLIKEKYSIIIIKVKQLFFHKIGGFVLFQTSPLIIYAYSTLTTVAIYGNYMLVINGLTMILNAIFNGLNAGIGDLVAEGNIKRIKSVFDELFAFRFLMVTSILYCFYYLINSFITIWIGENYLFSDIILLLLVTNTFIMMMRGIVDSFIAAYGLFKDIWAPIIEAVLNLSLSIILGYFYGIQGVLLGVNISLFLVIFIWKPYFLFKKGLQISLLHYIKLYLIHILVFIFSVYLTSNMLNHLLCFEVQSYVDFFRKAIISFFIFSLVEVILLYLITDSMKLFVKRFLKLIRLVK